MYYYLGIIIILFLALQLLLSLVNYVRRSRVSANHYLLENKLLELKFEQVLGSVDRQKSQTNAWSGWRKFRVSKIVQENKTIKSFYLEPHDGKKLSDFLPGQHLVFRLKVPGRSKPVIRCYSLSSSAMETGHYRISIRKQSAPPNTENISDGVSSCYFHDDLQEQAILDVRAPTGKFFLDTTENTPVVMAAGGVGVTPFLSMLNTLHDLDSQRELWLFYAVRDQSDLIMVEQLEKISRKIQNLSIHYFFNEIEDSCLSSYRHRGFVSAQLLIELGAPLDADFFVCGPPMMMAAMISGLPEVGVDEKRIHFESFEPASLRKAPIIELPTESTEGYSVNFQLSNSSTAWSDSVGTLLETAESAGVAIDNGCRAGSCGTCLTTVLKGEVNYIEEPGIDVKRGSCLPCIAIPRSNVILNA